MNDTLIECVRRAGALLLQHFGGNIAIQRKGNVSDVVTAADLASERLITDLIRSRYPEHNLLCEEAGLEQRGSEFTWVIDPLDGTSNFAAGLPWFGVMIAVLQQARPILAAMYLPVPDVLYFAEHGRGASRNGKPLRLNSESELGNVLCAYGLDAGANEPELGKQLHLMRRLVQQARNVRLTNSLQDFAYTLDGQFGACVNQHCMIWDIAPACLLFPEAGGRFTDLDGRDIQLELAPAKYLRSYAIIGANPALHKQVVNLAKEAAAKPALVLH